MGNFGSRLRNALGALLLLGFALGAWAVTITLTGDTGGSVLCSSNTVTVTDSNVSAIVPTACIPTGGGGTGSFTLSVSTSGTGAGTVTSVPAVINCGGDCSEAYPDGTPVSGLQLTATATSGTFTNWSGACSGTTNPCTVPDFSAATSVTAVFTAPVSTGGDPGTNPWINGTTYAHNRGSLGELFVPRCVPTQYTNCRNGGAQSAYDTVRAGQTWAMRIPFGSSSSTSNFGYSLAREDSVSVLTVYDMALSTAPNDFSSTNANCAKFNSSAMTIRVHDSISVPNPPSWWGSCPLARDTHYYLNVRPAAGTTAATACGNSSTNACRYKIMLPAVAAGFYTN